MNNLEKIQYPVPKQEYKVLVRCFTYNQGVYIVDALNGFAMQQTNFPFVCLVMDDASTDGEQNVIKAWMERECAMSEAEIIDIVTSVVIIVPHKNNPSCTFAFYLLKKNLHGTGDKKMNHVYPWREKCVYEALCEGDDYWTDPLKLQKQVDFMERHPNYSLCFHAHNNEYSDGKLDTIRRYSTDVYNFPMEDMILGGGGFMATNSMLFKSIVYKDYPEWALKAPVGDLPLMLVLAANGKVGYINDVMSCYRVLSIGSWSQKMTNDIRKQVKLNSEIKKMWIAFDNYTSKKYHWTIVKRMINNELNLLKQYISFIIRRCIN